VMGYPPRSRKLGIPATVMKGGDGRSGGAAAIAAVDVEVILLILKMVHEL
jgi:hypothetical protein